MSESLDDPDLLRRFAAAYRGPHRPEDALWWLRHPDEPGPSGAPPPSAEPARLRRDLYLPAPPPQVHERFRAAEQRVADGTALAADALRAVERRPAPTAAAATPLPTGHPVRSSHGGQRLWAAAGACAVLAGAVAAGLALAPRPPAPDPPLRLGPALWSGHGTTAASSPTLAAEGAEVVVRLTCRGQGRILLALGGSVRSLACRPGTTIRDDQLFTGRHFDVLLSLSLVDHPSWTASVHRVVPAGSAG